MEAEQEVIVDETVLGEEQIETFGWEDYLCESWLDERREQKRKRSAHCVSV